MKQLRAFIPLVIFGVLVFFLLKGLDMNPREVPSALINKPVPEFSLSKVTNAQEVMTKDIFKGQVSLLNIWATWCFSCRAEHDTLMRIAHQYQVPIIGVDYKDERQSALDWLNKLGNPYQLSLYDERGRLAIDLGVYGTPETFVVDKKGIIRYKHIGPLTLADWHETIQPLMMQLEAEKESS